MFHKLVGSCWGLVPLLSGVLVLGQQSQAPGSAPAAPASATGTQDSANVDDTPAVTKEQFDLWRKEVRSQRKQIIAQNMQLTESQAQRFWPVYDQYTADLIKVNDTRYQLIQDYLQNRGQLSDPQAAEFIDKWLQVDQDTVALRKKYVPEFRKVLPPKKVALYEQLDRRTQLLIDFHLASQIPLIEAGH